MPSISANFNDDDYALNDAEIDQIALALAASTISEGRHQAYRKWLNDEGHLKLNTLLLARLKEFNITPIRIDHSKQKEKKKELEIRELLSPYYQTQKQKINLKFEQENDTEKQNNYTLACYTAARIIYELSPQLHTVNGYKNFFQAINKILSDPPFNVPQNNHARKLVYNAQVHAYYNSERYAEAINLFNQYFSIDHMVKQSLKEIFQQTKPTTLTYDLHGLNNACAVIATIKILIKHTLPGNDTSKIIFIIGQHGHGIIKAAVTNTLSYFEDPQFPIQLRSEPNNPGRLALSLTEDASHFALNKLALCWTSFEREPPVDPKEKSLSIKNKETDSLTSLSDNLELSSSSGAPAARSENEPTLLSQLQQNEKEFDLFAESLRMIAVYQKSIEWQIAAAYPETMSRFNDQRLNDEIQRETLSKELLEQYWKKLHDEKPFLVLEHESINRKTTEAHLLAQHRNQLEIWKKRLETEHALEKEAAICQILIPEALLEKNHLLSLAQFQLDELLNLAQLQLDAIKDQAKILNEITLALKEQKYKNARTVKNGGTAKNSGTVRNALNIIELGNVLIIYILTLISNMMYRITTLLDPEIYVVSIIMDAASLLLFNYTQRLHININSMIMLHTAASLWLHVKSENENQYNFNKFFAPLDLSGQTKIEPSPTAPAPKC